MAFYPTILGTTNNTTVKTALQTESVISKTPIGSMPAGLSTITCAEYTAGGAVTTVLTLNNFVVFALAGAAAALAGGSIIYSFPASDLHTEASYSFDGISLTAAGTAVAGATLGIGSVVASGAVATLAGTATFMDRLTQATVPTASGGGAATSALANVTAGVNTGIGLNVAASVKNVFLNSSATWNANNTGNLTASGRIFIQWNRMSF
jgi:hypothetical protein